MEAHGETTRVHLRGDLDCRTALLVAAALAGLRDHHHHTDGECGTILLDLAAVTFMDTSGLTAITDALPALADQRCEIRLVHARPQLGKLLSIAVQAGWLPPNTLDPA